MDPKTKDAHAASASPSSGTSRVRSVSRVMVFFWYAVCVVASYVVAWFFWSVPLNTFLPPETSTELFSVSLLAPLAGLAAFQLLFGSVTGRWRSWRFWVIAPLVIYGTLLSMVKLADTISISNVLTIGLTAPFILGLCALIISIRTDTPPH
ncbi:MAG: hypothetical protein DI498_03860 [Paracoccus denitrificans]|nr:MAG: hypothetical protein DI498_03860 [Paracoccus denitrificans]PZO85649.1 MAG: hypothetical protein DI633_03860 [Paracoccus denitrificans]